VGGKRKETEASLKNFKSFKGIHKVESYGKVSKNAGGREYIRMVGKNRENGEDVGQERQE